MIQGIYETHIPVADLNRSIDFYKNLLQSGPALIDQDRRIAFFWVGQNKNSMLGLWEKPANECTVRHFAFHCSVDDIISHGRKFLIDNGLRTYNFLRDGSVDPVVFPWMPAVSLYFDDPDGHWLELIAILPGEARPDLNVMLYNDYIKM
jgi:catechol 2,3-dioxygenase-like lactoylglutathione lyase family enzyme